MHIVGILSLYSSAKCQKTSTKSKPSSSCTADVVKNIKIFFWQSYRIRKQGGWDISQTWLCREWRGWQWRKWRELPLEMVYKLYKFTQLFKMVWRSSGVGLYKILVLSVCLCYTGPQSPISMDYRRRAVSIGLMDYSPKKLKLCYNLLLSFQTCTTFLFLWNTNEEIFHICENSQVVNKSFRQVLRTESNYQRFLEKSSKEWFITN